MVQRSYYYIPPYFDLCSSFVFPYSILTRPSAEALSTYQKRISPDYAASYSATGRTLYVSALHNSKYHVLSATPSHLRLPNHKLVSRL